MLREEANARAETVYVMKAMSHSSLLYHQLRAGGISEETFESMGRQFAAREHTAAQPDFAPADSFAENVTLRIRDLKDWVLKISHHVHESQLNAWLSFVENGVKEMKRENRPLAVTFDVHSINAFFADGVLLPFDTQPWKKEWFWGPEPMNAYRLATDIFAFSGEEAGRAFLRGYASGTKREVFRAVEEKTWIVYAALIMLAYLYMLGEKDAEKREGAELYRKFLQEYRE